VTRAKAFAKINLALIVGPGRPDGRHEVVTLLERVGLHDDISLDPAEKLAVEGYADDTLVRAALDALARAAGLSPAWRVVIEKRIPVAAGLGGGSSDAAAALRLGNALLEPPLPPDVLHRVAAAIGSDVPFFLRSGARLATGAGSDLAAVDLPSEYAVLLVLPHDHVKESTAAVYRDFDARAGHAGFDQRRAVLYATLERVRAPRDLSELPPNDLATSPLADALAELGAFRADVSGAGPAVYGLFDTTADAEAAAEALRAEGRTWVTRPVAGPCSRDLEWQDGPALGRGQVVRQRVLVP
jgi:4-diphosphocytidyl-2-C-methyl-D-erythritol kinase